MHKKQDLFVTTYIKFDMWDRLKVLFGRAIKVDTKIIVPQEQPIENYNAVSTTTTVSSTGTFIKQDRPRFGYVAAPENT